MYMGPGQDFFTKGSGVGLLCIILNRLLDCSKIIF